MEQHVFGLRRCRTPVGYMKQLLNQSGLISRLCHSMPRLVPCRFPEGFLSTSIYFMQNEGIRPALLLPRLWSMARLDKQALQNLLDSVKVQI